MTLWQFEWEQISCCQVPMSCYRNDIVMSLMLLMIGVNINWLVVSAGPIEAIQSRFLPYQLLAALLS